MYFASRLCGCVRQWLSSIAASILLLLCKFCTDILSAEEHATIHATVNNWNTLCEKRVIAAMDNDAIIQRIEEYYDGLACESLDGSAKE